MAHDLATALVVGKVLMLVHLLGKFHLFGIKTGPAELGWQERVTLQDTA